ncbi:hypothetical protein GKQ77_05295 [Streptomyces sp. BG9H]|uniref:Uncharacterized protein n=1 Tax=Streptomyces anatolicus TaxID=2675858 RepID=A0ABS6YKA4_9ACTN|nr:cytochrome P450 [Streptomyces anatolicus]MBW5420986.1 hypothetical protein [Streptomyces anatolicus]
MVSLAAANRDPARFTDADRLDLERVGIDGHVALGAVVTAAPEPLWPG